jgi:hypothetical protein
MSAVQKQPAEEVGFSDVYPEDIADRLAWFARELGVSDVRMLNLLGLGQSAAAPDGRVDWHAVVRDHEEEAWWAETVLYDTLLLFRFDPQALRHHLSTPAARDFLIPGLGGNRVAASHLSPAERDRTLLTLVAAGNVVGHQALVANLAQPENSQPTAP